MNASVLSKRCFIFRLILVGALLAFGVGCTKSPSDISPEEPIPLSAQVNEISAVVTDANGMAVVPFDVPEGTTAFQIIAQLLDPSDVRDEVEIDGIFAPDGTLVSDKRIREKMLGESQRGVSPVTAPYPLDPNFQGTITPGRYLAEVRAFSKRGTPLSGARISAKIVTKKDSGSLTGTAQVNVNVILAGATADDRFNKIGLDDALVDVQNLYKSRGIRLRIRMIERRDLPSILPNPRNPATNSIYRELGFQYPQAINVVLGVDVRGLKGPNNAFAIGGSTPLPAEPTGKSAIAVSLSRLGGTNGELGGDRLRGAIENFFNNEPDQAASVIGHEIGHALGLKNTVEIRGDKVIDNDLLSDTQSCIDIEACRAERGANENIMFPFTLLKEHVRFRGPLDRNSFLPRDKLSEQQGQVIRKHVLVKVD